MKAVLPLPGLPLLTLVLLGGCGQVADISGAVTGAGAALVSSNPAVGYAVGIGVRAGVSATMKGVMRDRQTAEQDAIAAVIGGLDANAPQPWQIRHTIPFGNQQGEVQLVRVIDSALAQCREALFSVVDGKERQWFLTTACKQGTEWKWAAAEPAAERWGSLQ